MKINTNFTSYQMVPVITMKQLAAFDTEADIFQFLKEFREFSNKNVGPIDQPKPLTNDSSN